MREIHDCNTPCQCGLTYRDAYRAERRLGRHGAEARRMARKGFILHQKLCHQLYPRLFARPQVVRP